MASAVLETCEICTNHLTETERRSVKLPCRHEFCLTCLVHLRTIGKHQCPRCRSSWAKMDLPALPWMEALAVPLQAVLEEEVEEDMCKNKWDGHCEKHMMLFEFCTTVGKELYCKKCVVDHPGIAVVLIEDAIDPIKENLARKEKNVMKKLVSELQSLDNVNKRFNDILKCVMDFKKQVEILETSIRRSLKEMDALRSVNLRARRLAKAVKQQIDTITTVGDVHIAATSVTKLQKAGNEFSLSTVDVQETLLIGVAFSYMKELKKGNQTSKLLFANELLKLPECSFGPLHKTIRATDSLKAGHQWTVDNENYETVFLALANKQPSKIYLLTRDDATEDFPEEGVAAIATVAKDCTIRVNFIDSFYVPLEAERDRFRLQRIISNPSLFLTEFSGHLDAAGIALLPHTVTSLGLAIRNAAEAEAVGGLQPWPWLQSLSVSVAPEVASEVLMPLPVVLCKRLHFPHFTLPDLEKVRASIKMLVFDLKITSLHFPKCELTAEGTSRLVQRLNGVMVADYVAIEAGTHWNPGYEEKSKFENLIGKAVGCGSVCW